MKIEFIRNSLIKLISKYLKNPLMYEQELYDFSWKVIDLYSDETYSKKTPKEENEKAIWYAIWQIQHLLREKSVKENIDFLEEALSFLKGKSIPEKYIGNRPL